VKIEASKSTMEELVFKLAMKKCHASGVVAGWVEELKVSKMKKAARKALMEQQRQEREQERRQKLR